MATAAPIAAQRDREQRDPYAWLSVDDMEHPVSLAREPGAPVRAGRYDIVTGAERTRGGSTGWMRRQRDERYVEGPCSNRAEHNAPSRNNTLPHRNAVTEPVYNPGQ